MSTMKVCRPYGPLAYSSRRVPSGPGYSFVGVPIALRTSATGVPGESDSGL